MHDDFQVSCDATSLPELPDGRTVVLIVDDTPDNLALLSDTLIDAGYAVLVALDGQSALQRLARVTPDVVLLDALMPGMDGFETCRHIKADPRNRHLPVIFMTALTESEHVVHGFRVGGIDYVLKPVKPSEVVARIAAHVQRSRQQRHMDMALEIGMRAALIVAEDGTIRWLSELARERLARYTTDTLIDSALPGVLHQWFSSWSDAGCDLQASFDTVEGSIRHSVRVLGRAAQGDWLLVLDEYNDATQATSLIARFGLTNREAEVLLWLSRGKTNRDIGEILGMAARTVNKHLEHVFIKLNVETRAAAAAAAVKVNAQKFG
ncbi:response regulator transcription factor [Paraburkholderia xenovorans]|uniref:response regulator n=1 Tax=Paraburkholderia xenovorans TaxID=36873 RepID=UPI0038B6BF44